MRRRCVVSWCGCVVELSGTAEPSRLDGRQDTTCVSFLSMLTLHVNSVKVSGGTGAKNIFFCVIVEVVLACNCNVFIVVGLLN